MHFSLPLLLPLACTIFAAPTPTPSDVAPSVAAAGSKTNVYLSTCTWRSLLSDGTSSSVILYNSVASTSASPSDVGTVSSSRAVSWAGATRRAQLDSGVFESNVDAGADALAKSQIAGTAQLGTGTGAEQFVCFRDGTSTFRFNGGLLGTEITVCTAEYWCASTNVGN
ncbi:hypothetical protein EJ02DRAFT_452368 [Clathrospora elynae]|uniref:AA1-like domain-containing protein n=1 Tax=Clathrospora elynae TaxID=706981 RepID=A0A6A5SV15_9PLEO|nr:hypothetical protein EJ02DRAFT_452368 [Clathrospora elynae]